MTSGGPDLFVICKHCGSEVSPYITECPYCGRRLRKRAPKLDRDGRPRERIKRRALRKPSLPRLRRGEIPGIVADRRPLTTIAFVLVSVVATILWRAGVLDIGLAMITPVPTGEWWRVATAPFVYDNVGYAFVALLAIAIFGWLIERRHGPLALGLLLALGGAGGMAVVGAVQASGVAVGGNGAALALLTAWAIPDVRERSAGNQIDGDLIGAAVFAAVLLLMPLAASWANELAGLGGIAAGLLVGFPLSRMSAKSA